MDLSHIINDDKIDLVRHDELERPEYVAETLMSLSTGSNSRHDMTERNEYIPDSQSVTVESSDDEDHSQANFGANMQLLQHLSELNIHLRFMRSRAEREAQIPTESVEYVSAAAFSDSISSLRTDIQDLFSQLGNSVNARLQELSNEQQNREKELRSSRKTADDEIENQWKFLSYSIRCLVFMLCQHKLKKYKSLKKSLKTTLEEVSPGIEELYNHQDFQQDVCQAYVWRRIYRGVFESKQCLWKPEAMESLKKAREILLDNAHNTDDLCRIGLYFSKTHQLTNFRVIETQMDSFTLCEVNELMQFVEKGGDEQLKSEMRSVFHDAARAALDLDRIFMSSKAFLHVGWPGERGKENESIDENYMEVVNWVSGSRRARLRHLFSISPFVEKIGNASGQNYDACNVLCKASVVSNGGAQNMGG